MTPFDDLSRNELLSLAKAQKEAILRIQNDGACTGCPFCFSTGSVPWLKADARPAIIEQWRKAVTVEEFDAYVEAREKEYSR